jgi:hypothetical protein
MYFPLFISHYGLGNPTYDMVAAYKEQAYVHPRVCALGCVLVDVCAYIPRTMKQIFIRFIEILLVEYLIFLNAKSLTSG